MKYLKYFENIDFDDFEWEEEEEKESLNVNNINIGDEVICIKDCVNGIIWQQKFTEVGSNDWYYLPIKKDEIKKIDGKCNNYMWFTYTKHGGYEYKNFEKI